MKRIRKILVCTLFLSSPVVLETVGGPISFSEAVYAEEKKRKTRRVPALREKTYKLLSEAQIMIDPESVPREEGEPAPVPKGTPADAVRMLQKALTQKGVNSYEKAQIWNTLAFAYYTLEDTPRTMDAYEQILKESPITLALELNALRALFQLHLSEGNYRRSIDFINRWQEVNLSPDADVTHFKAIAYYQLEDNRESLSQGLLTEEIALAQERTMKESWLELQVVNYYSLEDIDNVIRVLEKLITSYPKKRYWLQLAGMYGEKGRDDSALSAYHAAYVQGFLEKETEVVMLSQRLMGADNPFEASQVLEKGLETEILESNEKNLKLLATAYTMAQETDSAIGAWKSASRFAKDGEVAFRLAQTLAQEDRHQEAIKAYREAQRKGKLKKPADCAFWKGISEMQLERWDSATKSFREAARLDKKKKKQTRNYIRYIAGERRRQKELKKMLEG